MVDYPDELSVKEYVRQYNNSPVVKDNNLQLVDSTLDKIKSVCLFGFGIICIILLVILYLFYNGDLTPVINNNLPINNTINTNNNFSVSPVVNVYVNIAVNNTDYNVTSLLNELNKSFIYNSTNES